MRIFCPAITRPSLLVSRLSRAVSVRRSALLPLAEPHHVFTRASPTHAVGRVAALMTRTTTADCYGSLFWGCARLGVRRNGISRCGTDTRPQRPLQQRAR